MKSKRVTCTWEFYRDNCEGFKEPMRKELRKLDDYVSNIEAENAELRELVRDLWLALWTCNQYACKHGKDGCYTVDGNNGGKCVLRDRMRELGVDA